MNTGVKLGGACLILIAIAEMIGARVATGYMIWNPWQSLAVDTMYAGLMVIAILSFLFNLILETVEHFVLPWRNRDA
jgi:ABC-type nitrate/sulfonate/bicarbonate transport system permease component